MNKIHYKNTELKGRLKVGDIITAHSPNSICNTEECRVIFVSDDFFIIKVIEREPQPYYAFFFNEEAPTPLTFLLNED